MTGTLHERSFVDMENNFMKFRDEVLTGVNCQSQKEFSPGGTQMRIFSWVSNFLTIFEHI